MPLMGAPDGLLPVGSPIDRAAALRDQPGILDELAADPTSRVLVLRGARAPLTADGLGLQLRAVHDTDLAVRALLGRDDAGAVLLAVEDDDADPSWRPPGGWAELRTVGGTLRARDADLATLAMSVSRWLRDAEFCPACGARTEVRQAGWSRHCPSCGREHFPRTDPAVIVAVTDGNRLLLGSNAAWPQGRYSCFAGFVEAGESAEAALVREIEEESGVRVTALEYLGSQAWPYPRSLMLGYLAHTSDPDDARPDGTEIVEVRWFEADEIGAALAGQGDVTLPGAASISRALIEHWHRTVRGGR
jgi:NAD+ diphosphatase